MDLKKYLLKVVKILLQEFQYDKNWAKLSVRKSQISSPATKYFHEFVNKNTTVGTTKIWQNQPKENFKRKS